jgi:thymidylate synthase
MSNQIHDLHIITTKTINFIMAISSDNVIGINNQIPWKIKEDLKHFKSLTTYNPNENIISNMVIMGVKTFESIGLKALSNRLNIVLTSKYESMVNQPNLIFLSNLSNAIFYADICTNIKTIWIIGGKQLFESIDYIKPDNVYLTKIHKNYSNMVTASETETNLIKINDSFFNSLTNNYKVETTNKISSLDSVDSTNTDVEFILYKLITSTKRKMNEYVGTESIGTESVGTESVGTESVGTESVGTESVGTESVGTESVGTESVETEAIRTEFLVSPEKQYLNLLKSILSNGEFRQTRNDFTWSDFGSQLDFDLKNGFPLLTSKKVPLRIIFEELMFFIRGYTDNKILKEKNIHIWNENTTESFIKSNLKTYENSEKLLETDDMGPMYGFQWRYFNQKYDRVSNPDTEEYYKSKSNFNADFKHDQLQKVINDIKTDPFSRRIIMTTFNPEQVSNGVLYPCHSIVIQFYAKTDLTNPNNLLLSIKMYQRSADLFLGLPFNIASTALLLYLVCDHLNQLNQLNKSTKKTSYTYKPSKVILTLGDTHIYQSHLNAVLTQLQSKTYPFPKLNIKHEVNNPINSIESYEWSNIQLIDYNADRMIKAKMVA